MWEKFLALEQSKCWSSSYCTVLVDFITSCSIIQGDIWITVSKKKKSQTFIVLVWNNPVSSHAQIIIWMVFTCCYLNATSESCLAAEQTSPRRVWNTFGSSLPIWAPSDMPHEENHTTRQLLRNRHMFPSDMEGTGSLWHQPLEHSQMPPAWVEYKTAFI